MMLSDSPPTGKTISCNKEALDVCYKKIHGSLTHLFVLSAVGGHRSYPGC